MNLFSGTKRRKGRKIREKEKKIFNRLNKKKKKIHNKSKILNYFEATRMKME